MFEKKSQGAVEVIGGGDRISGEQVTELSEMLDSCLQDGQPQVVLDLHCVAIIDSAGLELLLDTQEKFHSLGGSLKLANAGALCGEVLKVTGVGARFESFADTRSAVRSFLL
jgi:anti-anti-sigma factor